MLGVKLFMENHEDRIDNQLVYLVNEIRYGPIIDNSLSFPKYCQIPIEFEN